MSYADEALAGIPTLYAPEVMTLRDYFAGQVLAGLSNRKGNTAFNGERLSLAKDAYSLADAMLEARK